MPTLRLMSNQKKHQSFPVNVHYTYSKYSAHLCTQRGQRESQGQVTLTLSPATFLGLTPLMMETASMTIRTPSGGLCRARTSTTSPLFSDFKLARAASCIHQRFSHEEYLPVVPYLSILLVQQLDLSGQCAAKQRQKINKEEHSTVMLYPSVPSVQQVNMRGPCPVGQHDSVNNVEHPLLILYLYTL